MIDYDGETPPYRQVANILAARIKSGELPPGARVPSITTLSQEYGIAKNTARRALTYLASEEAGRLVIIQQGWGTFVRQDG
jgi:DNA-binding GntR family transcriptional regulator